MDTDYSHTHRTDEEILAVALREVVNALGLEPGLPTYDALQLVRLYDNLATQFGGDEELMRHWVHNRNSHLRFTPYARAHNPRYLLEMNEYLESFLNR